MRAWRLGWLLLPLGGCFAEPDFTEAVEPDAAAVFSDAAPEVDGAGVRDAGDAGGFDAGPDAAPVALVGAWVSEGGDVAPLLAGPPANLIRLEAHFGADGALRVALTNERSQRFELGARYTLDSSTDPAGIEVVQHEPEPARLEGIWRVEGAVLTYEVAQTEPPIANVTPPTAAGGFGSTSHGAYGRDNVQTYRRAP